MTAAIFDVRAIQERCFEIGIRDLKGDVIEPGTRCYLKRGLRTSDCFCHRADGGYDPRPIGE